MVNQAEKKRAEEAKAEYERQREEERKANRQRVRSSLLDNAADFSQAIEEKKRREAEEARIAAENAAEIAEKRRKALVSLPLDCMNVKGIW